MLALANTTLNQFTCLKSDFSTMQESKKTTAFVGGAALMVVAAAVSHFVTQPRTGSDFAKVGEPFFETFDSSDQATSLEVVAIDPETLERNRFKVAKVDGLWRIPSHDNYPAEASARLATTASSIIGIERESLAGRGRTDFERLGVEDPLSDEIEDPETTGQRITLKDQQDETLADYIIGKQVEDVAQSASDQAYQASQSRQTYFYVRRADEYQTYIVPLKLDLSTKFSDWIDPDLLRFETSNLSQITVRNYSLEEQVGGNPLMPQRALVKKAGDTLNLTKSEANAWQLAEVDAATEDFDPAGVTEMVNVLKELRIEDVRPKLTFQGKQLITPDLKLNVDPEFAKVPEQFNAAIQQLANELTDKGFNLAGSQQQLELVSNHGEIQFGTTDGLRYTLQIGAPFEESDGEIKVSGSVEAEEEEAAKDEPAAGDLDASADAADVSDDDAGGDSADDDSTDKDPAEEEAKSRFMLVRVQLDESLLTDQPEQPTKPVKPSKPEGYAPLPEPKIDAADAASDSGDATSDDEPETEKDDSSKEEAATKKEDSDVEGEVEEAATRSPEFEAYDVAMEEYEQASVDYELALTRFEDDEEAFGKRVEEAKKLEAELNERFGEWYYVISGENLKALQVTRDDLVTKKEVPPAAPEALPPKEMPNRPDITFEGGPDLETDSEPPATEPSDAADESESSEPKSDASASETVEGSETEVNSKEQMEQPKSETSDTETADGESADGESEVPDADAPATAKIPKPPTTPPAAE